MMIELAGASGAGKSTIADLVQGLLQEKGVQALPAEEAGRAILRRMKWRTPWRAVKAWQGLRFSLEHPSLVWIALAAQWGRPIPWHHRRLALRWASPWTMQGGHVGAQSGNTGAEEARREESSSHVSRSEAL